jgi:sulfatase modifying factor 1
MSTLVAIGGGAFPMGDASEWAYPEEGPVHEVVLSPYRIDALAVSNARFAAFVDASGYRTDAERAGSSFVFAGLLPDDVAPTRAVAAAPWWRLVEGADWRHPEGPGSRIEARLDHPVVHVSWHDAVAFCEWSGTRLPTEAEWECAARGGTTAPFPWGDELEPGGAHRMNVFQGSFPDHDIGEDGYVGTAPVDAYPPNAVGLHNTTGNVWEWCIDWYDPGWYDVAGVTDPTGPPAGSARVLRGGSYLCHPSHCARFRPGARSSSTPPSTAGNVGFRVAADA